MPTGYTSNVRAEYYGMFKVTTAGTYTFYIKSDDGSRITVNNNLLPTSNWFSHGMREESASINLGVGW